MANQKFTKKVPTELDIHRAAVLFQESASLASCISELASEAINSGADDLLRGHQLTLAAGRLAEKIGWISDLGGGLLTGDLGIKGEAEDWLLPPVYFSEDKTDL